jgi:iron-sulfur cluster insertion protein
MITLTETAGAKVKSLLESENKQNYGLRVYVSGGGCHGFQYGMSFEEKANEDDQVLEYHGVKLFLDPQSSMLLNEAVVDYVEGLEGAGFAIKNPQAKSTCGCGHSFSV